MNSKTNILSKGNVYILLWWYIKARHFKHTVFNVKTWEASPVKSGIRQGCSLLPDAMEQFNPLGKWAKDTNGQYPFPCWKPEGAIFQSGSVSLAAEHAILKSHQTGKNLKFANTKCSLGMAKQELSKLQTERQITLLGNNLSQAYKFQDGRPHGPARPPFLGVCPGQCMRHKVSGTCTRNLKQECSHLYERGRKAIHGA